MKRFKDCNVNEQYMVRLKVVVGKYDIQEDGSIYTKLDQENIIICENEKEVFFMGRFDWHEPSATKLVSIYIDNPQRTLQDILSEYKKNGFSLGKVITFPLLKMYHKIKPEILEKNDVRRRWIDYERQIKLSGEIWDEYDSFGVWATKMKILPQMCNNTYRYGESIMILEAYPDDRYILSELEVVGYKFKVIYYGKLSESKTWEKLKYYGCDIEKALKQFENQ